MFHPIFYNVLFYVAYHAIKVFQHFKNTIWMAYVVLIQNGFFQVLNQSNFSLTHLGIRQLKNILAYYNSPFNLGKLENVSFTQLLQMEFLLALKSQLEDRLDRWQAGRFERLT